MPSLAHLPVSALGTAAERIVELVRATNNDELIRSTQFLNLETKEGRYACGFNKLAACLYTKEVIVADKKRDCCLIALYAHVTAERHSPYPEAQRAAQRIYNVMKAHGTAAIMGNMSLGEESMAIRKLLTNLVADTHMADMDTTNLAVWVGALSRAQKEFEAVYARRASQNVSDAEIFSATTQRRELEAAIRGFMKYVDAMATVGTDPLWPDLNRKIEDCLTELAHGLRSEGRPKPEAMP